MSVLALRRAKITAAVLIGVALLATPYSLVWSRQADAPTAPPAVDAVSTPGGTAVP
jgi:hypothetical protein